MTLAPLSDPPAWAVNGTYRMARPGIEWFFRRVFDLEITGRDRLPDRAGYILAPNHMSFLDPVLTGITARRNVRYMAVGFLFNQSALFDKLILFYGAIPTTRDAVPIGAIRTALEHLESGGVIGIFPEGRRVSRWQEEPPNRGAAWMSMATGVPVYPLAMQGTSDTLSVAHKRLRRAPLRVWVEEPLDPLSYVGSVDPTAAMMRDWQAAITGRIGPWWEDRERTVPGPREGEVS